jgi:hypothetical protein
MTGRHPTTTTAMAKPLVRNRVSLTRPIRPTSKLDPPPNQPIFVDRSGRRRRVLTLIGASLAVAIVLVLVMLGAAVSGVSPLKVPGFPDPPKPGNVPAGGPGADPAAQTPLQGVGASLRTSGTPPPGQTTAPGLTPSPSPTSTSLRHTPTQTPSHSPKPH